MKAVPLTRGAALLPFLDFLESGGGAASSWLRASKLSAESVRDPESLIPLHHACRFIFSSARGTGEEDIGFQVGAATTIRSLGLFGQTLHQSLTLKDLLEKICRFTPMLNSGASVRLEKPAPQTLRVLLEMDEAGEKSQAQAYSLMLLLNAVRLALGPDWRPRRAAIDRNCAHQARHHEILADAEIDDSVDHVSFDLPLGLLGRPVARTGGFPAVPSDPGSALSSTAPALDFAESVAQAIHAILQGGAPTIEEAAEMASTSPRTFQRRLGECGVT